MRFFKWLYYPDIEPDKRSKPVVIENIPKLKRKEKSIYKPSDLWTQQDDLLFLKYCPTKRENSNNKRRNKISILSIRDYSTRNKSKLGKVIS
jgi:hypothetical protein